MVLNSPKNLKICSWLLSKAGFGRCFLVMCFPGGGQIDLSIASFNYWDQISQIKKRSIPFSLV